MKYPGALVDSSPTLMERLRALDPDRVDLILALALIFGSTVELGLQLGHSRRPALTLITLLIACAAVAVRRRWPVPLAAAGLVCVLLFERLAEIPDWMLPSIAVLILMYTVGMHVPSGRGLVAGGALLVGTFIVAALDPSQAKLPVTDAVVPSLMFCVLPFGAGRVLAGRRAVTNALEARALRLEQEREARARSAAAAERVRIARELHDVIAHSVSVMVIQTQAARRVASADRDAARAALASVEGAGRDALVEMRRMVGVLRRGDEAPGTAATPGLGELSRLADRARAAGLPVELHVEGDPIVLPPGVDLAAYRVVQEALTNVVKHAGPARAIVTVEYRDDELHLEILDTGRGQGNGVLGGSSGHGLIGMHERLGIYGGELTAGRRTGGGFSVSARIPLSQVAV